jgi:hypothetical protein
MFDVFFTDPPFSTFTSAASKQWLQEMVFDHAKKRNTVVDKFHFYRSYQTIKSNNKLKRFFKENNSKWVKNYNIQFPKQKMLIVFDEAATLLVETLSLAYTRMKNSFI